MKPLISVRIMLYKNFENIERALQSIAMQKYPRIEVIISDDCTPGLNIDDIKKIASKYERYFENVIVNQNPENFGTVRHENIVNGLCTGDIFCELGAEDFFYGEDTFAKVVEYFEKTDYLVFTSKRLREVANRRVTVLPFKRNYRMIEENGQKLRKCMFRRYNYISTMGTFYKREVFDKNGGFDERFRLIEDYSLYVKFLLNNEPIGFYNIISCVHTGGGVSARIVSNPVLREDNKNINNILLYEARNSLDNYTKRIIETKYELTQNGKKNSFFILTHLDVFMYMFYVKMSKGFRTIEVNLRSEPIDKFGTKW